MLKKLMNSKLVEATFTAAVVTTVFAGQAIALAQLA